MPDPERLPSIAHRAVGAPAPIFRNEKQREAARNCRDSLPLHAQVYAFATPRLPPNLERMESGRTTLRRILVPSAHARTRARE